ncbi:shufflon system plasmid conjugative transfer pilus tip adhesin PilV, partial [Klebsiella pneumoniae]|uniref:shufflon system plasmid conjugative transfer pilus tip adhesin PilV n=1 Tax=Klebsiella pneumoniae TaxID=573 RepID=UPI002FEF9BD3
GIGRTMTLEPEGLESNLNTLVEYNQLNKNKLQHIWVSNINNELIENIMQYANQYEWELPRRQPLHMIDHSFGPGGEYLQLERTAVAGASCSPNGLVGRDNT